MSDTGDPALIGRRVAGKFLIEKFLGGGAMGAVYRAKDTTLDRFVALKVMHATVAVDPAFVNRFHREARAASRLDHPNSMRVIEFGAEPDGLLYIAMEYLEGRDLYRVIHEDWPLSNERIAHITMKALAAITMAHEMGVIHRDLKPENIMILNRKDDEGFDIVKVCDFGIAKITEAGAEDGAAKTAGAKLTTAGLVVGTPEYMSPEQARGEKLDARSDLYSMGIILYQLLTGRTPFLADTALAVVLKHISEAPTPPRTIFAAVHPGLEAVCMRALGKTREDRFQSARDMRTAIRAVMEGRPMPVDSHGATAVDPGSQRSFSSAPPAAGTSMSSPPLGMGSGAVPAASKVTPLGTALATQEERRSRAPLYAMVAVLALAIGAMVALYIGRNGNPIKAVGSAHTLATAAPAPTEAKDAKNEKNERGEKIERDRAPSPVDRVAPSASSQEAPGPKSPHAPPNAHPKPNGQPDPKAPGIPTTQEADPTPPPAPEPQPPPPPLPETRAPVPPPPAPAPAPAPAFNAATCRAVLGPQKSASGYNANNLSLRGTDAAWTQCARSSIKERPAAPIAATVHLRFSDNRSFRGASCTGCAAPALAACIASSTGKTVQVNFKSGDATGDPEFDVPVSFTCE